jgi:ATP-dependent Clp protease adapter protein ClpS
VTLLLAHNVVGPLAEHEALQRGHTETTTLHLVRVIFDILDCETLLALPADKVAALTASFDAALDRLPVATRYRAEPQAPSSRGSFAVFENHVHPRPETIHALLWAIIEYNDEAGRLLTAQGITRWSMWTSRPTEARPRIAPRPAIVLRDDDVTTFEFVVENLQSVAGLTSREALAAALATSFFGSWEIPMGSVRAAEEAAHALLEAARKAGFPWAITIDRGPPV